MEISCRQFGGLVVLDLEGRCLVSAGETELAVFRATIAQLVAEGRVHVAANLANLKSVDARGLAEFVVAHRKLAAAGGKLTIVAANVGIRRMLSVTRLDTVLQMCESDDEIDSSARCAVVHPHRASAF